jgi:alkylated DNA repair dioxygenase AlkB
MNARKHIAAPQLSLFNRGQAPATAPSFGEPHRVHLDGTSWVEHFPRWLAHSDLLFASLSENAGWEQRTRWMFTKQVEEPRLTAEYPLLMEAPVLRLREIGSLLSAHYEIPYDSAWLNLYRDHRDSTSWHADRPSCKRAECIVPVLSLGETRRFVIRPKDGGQSIVFVAADGDLIVMGGRCQRDWVHCVPKETRPVGARISVNFASSLQAIPEPE